MKNYYLDLDKVRNLSDNDEKSKIHEYYRDLVQDFNNNNSTVSFFYTLYYNGFLKELREEKIEKILG